MIRFNSIIILALLFCATVTHAQTPPAFDQLIPSNTLLYVESDTTQQNEPLFPNYEQALKDLVATMDDFLEWKVLRTEWEATLEEFGLQNGEALMGKQWCFSVSGLDIAALKPPTLIYITRLDDTKQASQVLSQLFENIAKLVPYLQSEQDLYRGFPIHYLYGPGRLPGLGLAYTYDDSTLMITTSKPALVKLIEGMEFSEDSLATNETYQAVLEQLPENRSWTVFWNFGDYSKVIKSLTSTVLEFAKKKQLGNSTNDHKDKNDDNRVPKELQDAFEDMNLPNVDEIEDIVALVDSVLSLLINVDASGLASSYDDDKNKNTISFTKLGGDMETSPWAPIFKRKPVVFPFEDYMVRRTGTLNAGNIFGPKDIWMLIQTWLDEIPFLHKMSNEFIKTWEKELDFSIEDDLLAGLGNEWCLMRSVIDLESVLPMNRVAYLIKVRDEKKARKGFAKLQQRISMLAKEMIVAGTETYNEIEINTLSLRLPITPFTPSWCIHENTLILSSDVRLLRDMLDIKTEGRGGIERNRYYSQLRNSILQPANIISFQDNESEFYAFREGLRRISSLAELNQSGDPRMDALPLMIMDRVTYLLTTFQILKGTSKHTTFDLDNIRVDTKQVYQDIRMVPSTKSIFRYKVSFGADKQIRRLAERCVELGDVDRAIRIYTVLNEFYPDNEKILNRLAELHELNKGEKSAIEVYDSALETMPETAHLIQRELLRKDVQPSEIIERVNQIASETQRIDEAAALLGIALGKREEAQDVAIALFKHIIEQFPSSPAAKVAKQEFALLSKAETAGAIPVLFVTEAPDIDGKDDEEVWNSAVPIPMQDRGAKTESPNTTVKLLHDPQYLYINIKGNSQAFESQKDSKLITLRLYISSQRDYLNYYVWEIPWGGKISLYKTQIDPFGFTLDAADKEPIKYQMKVSLHSVYKIGAGYSREIALPLEPLKSGEMTKPIWSINVVLCVEKDDHEECMSLTEGETIEDIFNYPLIQLEQ